jgi:hypothetical protein
MLLRGMSKPTDSTYDWREVGVQANGIPGRFMTHPMTFEVLRL